VKNITVAIDDETYRRARVVAAQRDASVSALVKKYLCSLTEENSAVRDFKKEHEDLLDSIAQRHPGFKVADNLPREDLYQRS
jgi:hypothetical protein